MAHGSREVEIKLAVPSLQAARRLLRTAGFRVSKRRVFEKNTVFDTPRLGLRNARKLIRVREAGGATILTYKGAPIASRHKSREELELEISDGGEIAAIFERLGFHPMFRYEKYRTEFRPASGSGVAMLDETPVGIYVELEGTPPWIARTARKLGFAEKDYITASYARLHLESCQRRGVKTANMVFTNPRASRS